LTDIIFGMSEKSNQNVTVQFETFKLHTYIIITQVMHTHGGLVDELLKCVQLDVCEDLVVLVQAGKVADGHEEVVGVVEHGV